MRKRLITAAFFTLFASVLPDIIINVTTGHIPSWLISARLVGLIGAALTCRFIKELKEISKYLTILAAAILMQRLTNIIWGSRYWKQTFDLNTFAGNIGGNILLKAISIVPIIVLLLIMLKSRREAYLCKGDLSRKADKIGWLGIEGNAISWGRLSVISAVLIASGTTLLTILTAPNVGAFKGTGLLIKYFPLVLLFAAANSFCEGVLYRSAVMSTLKRGLPKSYVVLLAALFFGIPHYYGIPSGPVGAFMSCVLGWYMCRSMYETNGFAASWIIHFMQDTVIFSTLCLMGNLL